MKKNIFLIIYLILAILLQQCNKSVHFEQKTKAVWSPHSSFAKLYGYVKYFHPSDEAASIDWDLFAIYGSKRVSEAKNKEELKAILEELFLPIAPSLKIYDEGEDVKFDIASITPQNPEGYDTISWQHLGNGYGRYSEYYKSKRTRRSESFFDFKKPMSVYFLIDGDILTGGELKVELMAKGKKVHNSTKYDILIGTKGQDEKYQYERLYYGHIDKAWNKLSAKVKINGISKSRIFIVQEYGKGELLIDNLKLTHLAEGKENTFFNHQFEEPDTTVTSISREEIEGLRLVGDIAKVGGYQSLGAYVIKNKYLKPLPDTLYRERVRFGEYVNKSIGNGLKCVFPMAVFGDTLSTYPIADIQKFSVLLDLLEMLKENQLKVEQLHFRIGHILNVWNTFQHFYPYFDVVEVDWQKALDEAIKETSKDKNSENFVKTMRRMIAKLKDGHGYVTQFDLPERYYLPFTVELIEEQLIVKKVLNDTIDIKPGYVLKSIDKKPAKELFNEVLPLISSATEDNKNRKASKEFIEGKLNTLVTASFKDNNNNEVTKEFARNLNWDVFDSLSSVNSLKSFSHLDEDILYIDLANIEEGDFIKNLKEVEAAKAVIMDLRDHPNQEAKVVIRHLLGQVPDTAAWLFTPKILYPDQEGKKMYVSHRWNMEKIENNIKAKFYVLINSKPLSYSESIAGYFEHLENVTIVGTPTAGTNGNIKRLDLPGRYYISWTGMKVKKQDGSQLHGVGITPDVYVAPTIKGIREGRDEILERALELAREEIKKE